MKEELNQELIAQGYLAYAFSQGGESPLKFEDNSDIVTDKDVNPIPVTPKGGKDPIPFVPRGSRNDLPYDILRRTARNVTVASNIEFKSKVVYGDGILVYREVKDAVTGKWEKQEVTRQDAPEIFDFLELNDFGHVRMELANDLCLFYDAYVEYVFDRNDPPRLVQVIPLETACSRISEIDEKEGRSLWHGYSAEWYLGTPTDLVATPLLDRRAPLRDLLTRMGRLPGKNGIAKAGRDRRFVHNLRINTPGRADGNWQWRAAETALTPALAGEIRTITARYFRARAAKPGGEDTPAAPAPGPAQAAPQKAQSNEKKSVQSVQN